MSADVKPGTSFKTVADAQAAQVSPEKLISARQGIIHAVLASRRVGVPAATSEADDVIVERVQVPEPITIPDHIAPSLIARAKHPGDYHYLHHERIDGRAAARRRRQMARDKKEPCSEPSDTLTSKDSASDSLSHS